MSRPSAMTTQRRIGPFAALALVAGLALTTVVPATVGSSQADAAAVNRAGVVVDPGDGSGPHTACVWFEEESISGLELLARSTFDAGVRAFGGLGGAVCSIDGTGCSTDSACLSCGGSQYWAYAIAAPGATSFTEAQGGAGSRTITDGAVDGWRWGSGEPPVYRSIDRICPASPPPAPIAPPPPQPPAPVAPSPVRPDPAPAPVAPVTVAPAGATTTTVAARTGSTTTSVPGSTVVSSSVPSSTSTPSTPSTTMTTAAEGPDVAVAAAAIRSASESDDGSGGGTGALAVAAVVLAAGLGAGAFWRLRRAR